MKQVYQLSALGFIVIAAPVAYLCSDNLVPPTGRALLHFFANQAQSLVRNGDLQRGHSEPQSLLVINAGNGRTGTASFVKAMERLGLKSYHMKEGIFETSGHMDLWSKFLVDKLVTFDEVMDAIANAGFNASADAPVNFFYKEQMQRYPNAPVILSIRSEAENAGEAWQRSLRESVFRFPPIMSSIPFSWIQGLKRFRELTLVVHNMMAGIANGTKEEIDPTMLANYYYEWIDEVQQTVPSEKLLVFKAEDGWKPLCQHISHVSPIVAENCREVIATGEAYPRVNDRESVQRTQFAMRCVILLTYASLAGLSAIVGLLVLRMLRYAVKVKCA
ncbi:hypothetical protein MPSEU_000534300 [Mayamaea pseudoterrestris]|nr:hypothetical protein MPSEU_000534300 [Mayamaea pseudoterrestris]